MVDDDATDIAQHLQFIQAVIARMAAASGLVKAWCLTVATATLGYAVTKRAHELAALTVFSVVMFLLLDAGYLREERKYRALYRDARQRKVDVFDMDARAYSDRGNERHDNSCDWRHVIPSWSLSIFYGPILALAAAILIVR